MDEQEQAEQLWQRFWDADSPVKIWHIPFPMGVFGTLRLGHGNSDLMGYKIGKRSGYWGRDIDWESACHRRAFLPHFGPVGLRLDCAKGASGVFEVFEYDDENWSKMIIPVDGLEGFHPNEAKDDYRLRFGGYHRTLVAMRILPDDFKSEWFGDNKDAYNFWQAAGHRSLGIPAEQWKEFPTIPCWVYSSVRTNEAVTQIEGHPIIWDGVTVKKLSKVK